MHGCHFPKLISCLGFLGAFSSSSNEHFSVSQTVPVDTKAAYLVVPGEENRNVNSCLLNILFHIALIIRVTMGRVRFVLRS